MLRFLAVFLFVVVSPILISSANSRFKSGDVSTFFRGFLFALAYVVIATLLLEYAISGHIP